MNRYMKLIAIVFTVLIFPPSLSAQTKAPHVLFKTTRGEFVVALNPEAAPVTVANFLSYVKNGFYDGTIFHRVIEGFMIQGGGFQPDMRPKSTDAPIKNEADNGLKNAVGTIAMARTPAPHSATAQFFINVEDNTFLDHRAKTNQGWGYCVFGKVVRGMETIKAIESSPTGRRGRYQDVPLKPIIIEQVRVLDMPAD